MKRSDLKEKLKQIKTERPVKNSDPFSLFMKGEITKGMILDLIIDELEKHEDFRIDK
jgi:hypothetical protein